MNERDFIRLAASILRAESEIHYYRNNPPQIKTANEFSRRSRYSRNAMPSVRYLSSALDKAGADYRFIEAGEKYASFIVRDKDYELYSALHSEKGITKYEHPFGQFFGYRFLYLMRPFELLGIGDTYCEIFFQLPCMSLTPLTWMPLDKIIQSLVWKSCAHENGLKVINPVCLYIYRLCMAVFMDKGFSAKTCEVLTDNHHVLEEHKFHDCMKMIFFKFTDEIIALLKRGAFDEVIPHYWKFIQY